MVLPTRSFNSDESYDKHEWKSEFATTQSGRNSPSLFSKLRKQFLAPPVRTVRSPKFTDEELDVLTGDLPYETNYTYAYSKIYDPTLPDHWQVPNLNRGGSPKFSDPPEVHWSAASISRQIFYIILLPFTSFLKALVFLIQGLHTITKILIVNIWENIFLAVKSNRFEIVAKNFGMKMINFTQEASSTVTTFIKILLLSFLYFPFNAIVYMKEIFSTKNVTPHQSALIERESRNPSITKKLRNRTVNSPSLSPARTTRSVTKLAKQQKLVFQSDEGSQEKSFFSPLSAQLNLFRSVKKRSVTPVRSRVSVTFKHPIVDNSFERGDREGTPLSVYGLRSTQVERNTPEPTHDIKVVNRKLFHSSKHDDTVYDDTKETPKSTFWLKIQNLYHSIISVVNVTNVLKTLQLIVYTFVIPFIAAGYVWTFIYKNFRKFFNSTKTLVTQRFYNFQSNKETPKSTPIKKADAFQTARKDGTSSPSELLENYEEQQSFFKLIPAIFRSDEETLTKVKAVLNLVIIDTLLIVPNFFLFAYRKIQTIDYRWILYPFLLLMILFILFFPFFGAKQDESKQKEHVFQNHDKKWCMSAYNSTMDKVVKCLNSVGTFFVNIAFEVYAFFSGTPNYISNVLNLISTWIQNIYHFVVLVLQKIGNFIYEVFSVTSSFTSTFFKRSIYLPTLRKYRETKEFVASVDLSFLAVSLPSISFLNIPEKTGAQFYEKVCYGFDLIRNWILFPFAKIAEYMEKKQEVLIVYRDRPAENVPEATTPIPVIMPIQPPPVIDIDKAAIVAEITEKIRSELSAQFHKDLAVAIENKYASIIESLSAQNSNYKLDNANLEALIRQLIYEYDADKTGQVDYALESSGASVLSTRCSQTYNSYSRLEKIWNIPLWYSTYGPRTVIQRNSKTLFPGECWSFKTGKGYLSIELSHRIDISSVSYEHIGKELAPAGNRQSAPRELKIWAYQDVDDLSTRVLIGEYTYDLDGPQLQFFIAKNKPDFPVKIVELEVDSNYGAPFTCLYRLRVHGKAHQLNF